MKVQLESTTKIIDFIIQTPAIGTARVQARIWEGQTDSGIPVIAFITRITVKGKDDQTQFQAELKECAAPSTEAVAFPLAMII